MTRLSVVVIGHNEGKRLERCLASVRAVEGITPAEIIYVDSASTDGSAQLAARMGATVIALSGEERTAARARNHGWRAATGDVILFLDGDTVLHHKFPSLALEALYAEPKRAAVWGHRRESNPAQSIYVRVLDLDWIHPAGDSPHFGGDVLIRRDVLEAVQGYDDTLIAGEEPEMSRRIRAVGWQIEHIDAPMVTHDLAILHFGGYWRRGLRTGYAFAQVAGRFRHSDDPFWLGKVRRNTVRGVFWLTTPLVAAGASLAWLSFWPIAMWPLLLGAAALRTARKQSWKGAPLATLLLHGLHSHLHQIPVMFGQLQYMLDERHSRTRRVIEYKEQP